MVFIFAYNEGVGNKMGGGGGLEFFGKFVKGGLNKMKWGLKFSKNCKVTPLPYN